MAASRSSRGGAELVLGDHRGRVPDQVHPGAVAAVLGTGGQHLGQHLGRVPVGEALDRPHLRLVQRVPGRVRVRGPVGPAVAEHRDHVPADRVGVERVGEPGLVRCHAGRHRVDHLRRHQHRHGGPLPLVGLQIGAERLGQPPAEHLAKLPDVLDAVRPLPLHRLPLIAGHPRPAGEPGPVRLGEFGAPVHIRLLDHDGTAFLAVDFRDDTLRSFDYTKEIHEKVPCNNKTSRYAPCSDA